MQTKFKYGGPVTAQDGLKPEMNEAQNRIGTELADKIIAFYNK